MAIDSSIKIKAGKGEGGKMKGHQIISKVNLGIRQTAKKYGYDLTIRRINTIEEKKIYAPIRVQATYNPWNENKQFTETYNKIKNNTTLDKARLYTLWELTKQVKNMEGSIIEIGCWKGGSGAIIAKSAEQAKIKETIYLIDTFKGCVKITNKDKYYKGGEHSDATKEEVEKLAKETQLNKIKVLQGIFPEETEKEIKSFKFRLAHIDVDTYQSAKDTTNYILPKLVKGGIMIYDDYGFMGTQGVTEYIKELKAKEKEAVLLIYNLNGQGIIIKR
ncbi:hypothetical protein LCGC14_2826420 [marine sediment metagenome]|uniref:Methyltransferase n=1 Tax=marine sediment metagenome TaxID=412755 RepID=A0A0F9ANT6_9ZZZZ